MNPSGRPVWDDIASAEDIRSLDPGPPQDWPSTPDLLVVGGGVIGLATAVMCRRAGMSVLVIERGRLAEGPSGRAAGGLSPDAHPEYSDEWRAHAHESLALHHELDGEAPYGLRDIDLLVLPDLVIGGQAHADPLRMCASFARSAGIIATHTESKVTFTAGGRIVDVHTDRGVVHPGSVVFATGGLPNQVPGVPQTQVKGHLIATEAGPPVTDKIVALPSNDVLIVQLPDGRLVAGGTKDVNDDAPNVAEDVCSKIRAAMVRTFPSTESLAITHSWCCFRPLVAGGLPVVDRVPGLTNAWVAGGFYSTGLLMAPVVGRLVTDWISSGSALSGNPWSIDRSLATRAYISRQSTRWFGV